MFANHDDNNTFLQNSAIIAKHIAENSSQTLITNRTNQSLFCSCKLLIKFHRNGMLTNYDKNIAKMMVCEMTCCKNKCRI